MLTQIRYALTLVAALAEVFAFTVTAQISTNVDGTPPTVALLYPKAGATVKSISQVEVTFNEDVIGVKASDLLINGQAATNVTQAPGGPFVFQFPKQSAGSVQVRWSGTHEITDTAEIANRFTGGNWTYQVDPAIVFGDIVITEFLAAGGGATSLRDEDGDNEDWIEIYNRGSNPVNLGDWSLSDDPKNPGQWVFPARTLGIGEYLVVFASAKDRKPTTAGSRLHTNFKVADLGEHIGLYTPESPRVLMSGFEDYPEQRADVSYGYDSNGALRYFTKPTPGAANGISTVVGVIAPVHVNVTRGHFSTPFNLILSCATPGVEYRYTTNGSEPTITNQLFPGSLRISSTTLFRAAAFKENYVPSKTVTHSYLFNLSAALRSLPVISIVTSSNNLYGKTGILGINGGNYNAGPWAPNAGATNDYHNPSKHGILWEKPTSVEFIKPQDNSGFQVDCGLRVQGSDYQRPRLTRTSKFSFRLYFRGDYGPGRLEYPMFPLTTVDRFDQLVLRAGFNEQANPFIRDEYHRRLSHDMGEVASHGDVAVVLVNGVAYTTSPYYNPTERVHEEFMQEHLGGGSEWDVVSPSFATGAGGVTGVIDGDRANFQSMVSYVRAQSPTIPAVFTEISRRLDLTNFVDYCMLNSFAAMGDWPANNWRAGRERSTNGIWRFIVWDAEWGMGIYGRSINLNSFTMSGGGPDDSGLASTGASEIAQIYDRLRQSYEFRLLWADRVQKHFFNVGALTGANLTNRFEQLRQEMLTIIPSMDRTILQWARDRQKIYFTQMTPFGLLLSSNAPGFSQFGGAVAQGTKITVTNVTGPIYYTLDGTDPRVRFTSAVSPTALTYSEPIALANGATLKARSLVGTNWSAVTEATFSVGSIGIPLRITEMMYHPAGDGTGEFIELQNTGLTPVDLGGMYFSGIDLVFKAGSKIAPGERIVLGSSADTNGFRLQYPEVPVYAWFKGSLNNAGERIALIDKRGQDVVAVTFSDAAGWPAQADGFGRSLEVVDVNGDPNDPANWQASEKLGGSAGQENRGLRAFDVRINELMAENVAAVENSGTHPDWVELYNSSNAPASLAGWSLSDAKDPRKFVFPAGTTIPPQGYLVIWFDNATNAPGIHSDFALNRSGESLFLYDNTTNRVDGVSFGAQVTDYSLGRIAGNWVLTTPTPKEANRAAETGAASNLVINEWVTNPNAGESDWVELYNTASKLPVSLQGLYLATSNAVQRLDQAAFIPAGGFVRIQADERVGPQRVNLKLAPTNGSIALYDSTASLVQRVTYGSLGLGLSQGRLPDGSTNIIAFPGTASPGQPNYTNSYTGPVINEVLASNHTIRIGTPGELADYIEMYNLGTTRFDLSGMSLSANKPDPGKWVFAPGTLLDPGQYLVIRCHGGSVASPGNLELGETLQRESGGVYLFNIAGQLVDSVEYGWQLTDLPIGRSGSQWTLLSEATPGAANAAPLSTGPASALRINEWLASPESGEDWFELYNSTDLPIDLSQISLTDNPSIAGRSMFRPAPLSYIEPNGFVKWVADGQPEQGRNHVNFSLDAQGDSILVYNVSGTTFTVIDSAAWGTQATGISQGSLPDGSRVVNDLFPTPAGPNRVAVKDTDNDGIPDDVEFTMGLNPNDPADAKVDADGDGLSNLQEYLAGTNHLDANSGLKLAGTLDANGLALSFNTMTNHSYSVVYADSLVGSAWHNLTNISYGLPRTVMVRDPQAGVKTRFYKVVTPAMP